MNPSVIPGDLVMAASYILWDTHDKAFGSCHAIDMLRHNECVLVISVIDDSIFVLSCDGKFGWLDRYKPYVQDDATP